LTISGAALFTAQGSTAAVADGSTTGGGGGTSGALAFALTPATRGAVSRDIIGRMKPTAWIVNIARGAIVDEAAMIDALREKRLGGAALDVFAKEPLPAESPLWSFDNVILTPHTSGDSPRVAERTLTLFAENLRRYKAGEPLVNRVDFAAGY